MKFQVWNQNDVDEDRDVIAKLEVDGGSLLLKLSYDGHIWEQVLRLALEGGITRSHMKGGAFGLPLNENGYVKNYTEFHG